MPLAILAALGVVLYGYAAVSYFRVWLRRRTPLAFAVAFAFALLAEALIISILSLPTSWRLSWWEWHVLMAISFFAIAAAASSEWYEERFSGLYLDETLAGRREVTVLFADLKGFTPFSEARGPEQVHAMLVAYFGELAPMITEEFAGEVQDFVGDQIFAIFNKRGDQPDHALQAARAALELQRRAEKVRVDHPEWPRFRVGINTGPGARRRRGGQGAPDPRRVRRHRQPRRAPGGSGAARRRRDRRRDARGASRGRRRRGAAGAAREGQVAAGRGLRPARPAGLSAQGWKISTPWGISAAVVEEEVGLTMTRQFTFPKVTEVPRGPFGPKRPPKSS